jgi:2-keto-4-pentenoate hydratase/2-oxohepta-3-ene-1,7-dioic acid hydratase in catechol pathway
VDGRLSVPRRPTRNGDRSVVATLIDPDGHAHRAPTAFTPTGPTIVAPAAAPRSTKWRSTSGFSVSCISAEVSELIWELSQLISNVSSVKTLHPGAVFTTGTPKSGGRLVDDDRIEVEIAGLDGLSARGYAPASTASVGAE